MSSYSPPPGQGQDEFARFILGIIKLSTLVFVVTILHSIGALNFDIDPTAAGGLDVGMIIRIIIALAPLLLLVSALRDLGVR